MHISGQTSQQFPQAMHLSGLTGFDGYEPDALGSVSASSTFVGQARMHKRHPLHRSRSISTFPRLAITRGIITTTVSLI